jgi:hypothetical protein
VLLASQTEDPVQGSSYWFCMAALGGVSGDLLCSRSEPGVPFVPRSMRSSGLLFLILRHLTESSVDVRRYTRGLCRDGIGW